MRKDSSTEIGQQGFSRLIVKVLKYIVFILLAIVMVPITIKSFSTINAGASHINRYGHVMPLVIGLGVVLLSLVIFSYYKKVMQLKEGRLRYHTIGLSVLILGLQMVILVLFNVTPTTDNYVSLDLASAMAEGKISELAYPGLDYFSIYGNMYFYTLLLMYVFKVAALVGIANYIKVAMVLNVLLIDLSLYFGYKIVIRLFDKKRAVLFLALTALNPLFYLVLPWTYTASYSMPFFMGIIYYGIVYYQTEKQWVRVVSIITIALCSVLGYFLRPTALIATIALVYTAVIWCISKKGIYKQLVLSALVFILIGGIGYYSVSKMISSYNPDREGNYPVTHWLMMGMHGEGRVNQIDNSYTSSFPTKEEKKQANIAKIKEYWQEEGASGYVTTLLKKIEIVWADGTCKYAARMQQDNTQSMLFESLAGGKKDGMVLYCQIYHAFLCLFITYSVAISLWKDRRNGIFTLQLILLGAVVFYLIWEAKELYRIPFIGLLVILALVGIDDKSQRIRKTSRNKFISGIAVVMVTTILLMAYQYDHFTKQPYNQMKYSIRSVGQTSYMDYMCDIAKENREIEQEFYARHSFNTIVLNGKKMNQGKQRYVIDLLDENRELCKQFTINNKKIKSNQDILLSTELLPGGQKYYIRIKAKNPKEKDSIGFGYRKSLTTSQYEGELVDLNNETSYVSDLFLQVMECSEATYISERGYCSIAIALLIFELLIGVGYYNAFIKNKDELKELDYNEKSEIIETP
ncbi:MAG: hypothetical protein Q4G58_08095 [bacterium]|nr:hypothetical protein [bacterium]